MVPFRWTGEPRRPSLMFDRLRSHWRSPHTSGPLAAALSSLMHIDTERTHDTAELLPKWPERITNAKRSVNRTQFQTHNLESKSISDAYE